VVKVNHAHVIPDPESFLGTNAPRLFVRNIVKDLDFSIAGIYVWIFDRRYAYVGSAKNLSKRLRQHCRLIVGRTRSINTSRKHSRVAKKYADSAELFILENGDFDMAEAYSLEREWIAFFHRHAPEGLLLNDHMLPGGGLSNKRAMQKRWTSDARKVRSDFMKKQVRHQWKNPEFIEINRERMRKLRATGWIPAKVQIVDVTTPLGDTYTLRAKSLRQIFMTSTDNMAHVRVFKSPMLVGWRLGNLREASGKTIPHTHEDEFKRDPCVKAIVGLRTTNVKLFALRETSASLLRPVYS
jgi:hypothetical protein